jgi:lipopolysaccharide export system permease protein
MRRTLVAYLLREVILYSAIGGILVSVVFLGGNLPRHLADLAATGFELSDLGALLVALLGMVATYVLPIAFLFGVLMTMGRMASDRELLAMQVSGIGPLAMLWPVLFLGALAALATAVLAQEVEYRARRELRAVATRIATRGTTLEPGAFFPLGSRILHARESPRRGELEGVMIADWSDAERPVTIFAELGHFGFDAGRGQFRFQLERGEIHVEPKQWLGEYQRISFESLDYGFPAAQLLAVEETSYRPPDFSNPERRAILTRAARGESLDPLAKKKPAEYEIELHNRYALPLAPLLFALVGVPLGVRVRSGSRSWGIFLCLALVFVYYLANALGRQLAAEVEVPAALAMWLPNGIFALLAVLLLYRATRPE